MINYEIRRGKAVITTKDTAKDALTFAEAHAHFPGQLKVWGVDRREYEITEAPPEPLQFKGAGGLRAGRGRR